MTSQELVTHFPLEQFDKDFELHLEEYLGRGASGSVYVAKCKNPDFFKGRIGAEQTAPSSVAVKIFKTPTDDYQLGKIRMEANVLCNRSITSRNIVKGYALYEDDSELRLVMELLTGGTLIEAVAYFEQFDEYDVVKVIHQLLKAVQSCHAKDLYHRDIKPENILLRDIGPKPKANDRPKENPGKDTEKNIKHKMTGTHRSARRLQQFNKQETSPTYGYTTLKDVDNRFQIVLADFELAKKGAKDNRRVGTTRYMAPEILKASSEADYSKADMWSLGCVAFLLLSGGVHFMNPSSQTQDACKKLITDYDALKLCPSGRLEIETISKEGKQFLDSLLHQDPDKRPTANVAASHLWFVAFNKGVKDPKVPGPIDTLKMRNIIDEVNNEREEFKVKVTANPAQKDI